MTPKNALDELLRFDLVPHVIFSNAATGRQAWNDLTLALQWASTAYIIGAGWRDSVIAEAVTDFVRDRTVQLESLGDAWCVWREQERWLPL
jgi:hypothetical protein